MHAQLSDIESKYRIFCNRTLNMSTIKAVGFDMDYTLAVYRPETFEALAYTETLKKLVLMGYPSDILAWKFDPTHMVRGLAIDKSRGNILKMDRHRYVKVAYHGFRELSREERRKLYDAAQILTYEEPDFALIDTLFTLADGFLFSQLVDLKDSRPTLIPKCYEEIYKDVRAAIDLSHRDGSIKKRVAEDPAMFIHPGDGIQETLARIRASGRKAFLVTNSLWDYTNVVMNFLFGNVSQTLNEDWTKAFDVVITGAAKPSFFTTAGILYEVDPTTGFLKNTDGLLAAGRVYQGGNFKQLHELLKIQAGSEVLYVGDHIYGDILRSKKGLGWRTMLVIAEVEHEIETIERLRAEHAQYEELLALKEDLEDQIQMLTRTLETHAGTGQVRTPQGDEVEREAAVRLSDSLSTLLEKKVRTRETLREKLRDYHRQFHPVWGELMKTGHQNSRFAAQVENYACLYTSKVGNLRFYSPNKSFRSTRDFMPHDFL